MRYILLFISIMGGVFTFNIYAGEIKNLSLLSSDLVSDFVPDSVLPSVSMDSVSSSSSSGLLPPVTIGTIYHDATVDSNGYFQTTWYGVPYICFDCVFNADGKTASGTWYKNDGSYDVPFPNKKPSENPSEKPSDSDKPGSGSSGDSASSSGDSFTPAGSGTGTPDGSDTGTGTTDGSTDGSVDGSSSGSSTLSPTVPDTPVFDFPVSDSADFSELLKSFDSCRSLLPAGSNKDPLYISVYNNAADVCNSILDKAKSLVSPGEMINPSDDHLSFHYKDSSGVMYTCAPNTGALGPFIIGSPVFPVSHVEPSVPGSVLFNYSSWESINDHASSLCFSAFEDYLSSLKKTPEPSDGKLSSDGKPLNCPAGYQPSVSKPGMCTQSRLTCPYGSIQKPDSDPGVCIDPFFPELHIGATPALVYPLDSVSPVLSNDGRSSSGDDVNGDVVAAINAFHADANKNHKETMNKLDVSDSDVAGIKNSFISDINDLISSTQKEISDSYDSGISELKSIFGDIDSYIPDIKLSFELPIQFTAGIQGHCVPLVFDFNISLVGLPSYHFHAEGIQACKLYDLYIRSIVEYMIYFMTALACRRIFTRAAEFISSN